MGACEYGFAGTGRGSMAGRILLAARSIVPVVSVLMTTAENDPDREHENQAEASASAAETPAGLRQAASGIAEAQAWKGQQIAKGWRKLVNALRRREEGGR